MKYCTNIKILNFGKNNFSRITMILSMIKYSSDCSFFELLNINIADNNNKILYSKNM